MPRIRTIAQLALALVLAVLLLYPLGWLFGAMRWPMYHSWGLMHGAFFSAIPALSIASFAALGQLRWFRRVDDPYRRIAGLLVGMAITAIFVVVNAEGNFSPWSKGSLSLYALAFIASAVLCLGAKTPMLVALMVPLPMLFNDAPFLMMSRLRRFCRMSALL